MAKKRKRATGQSAADVDIIVDGIKDEIDELSSIRGKKARAAAARELIEYIELHHEPARGC